MAALNIGCMDIPPACSCSKPRCVGRERGAVDLLMAYDEAQQKAGVAMDGLIIRSSYEHVVRLFQAEITRLRPGLRTFGVFRFGLN